MNNYYLKFDTKETMETLFESLGWKHSVEYDEEVTEFYAWFDSEQNNAGTVEIIGDMWNPPVLSDEFNEDGTRDVVTEAEKIDGYHVNITTDLELPSELVEYLVSPATPERLTSFFSPLKYVDYDSEVASLSQEEINN